METENMLLHIKKRGDSEQTDKRDKAKQERFGISLEKGSSSSLQRKTYIL